MTTVFITGDRSFADPIRAAKLVEIVMAKCMLENPEGVRFMTGDSTSGIERAVRYMVPEPYLNVISYSQDDEGHVQFEEAFKIAATEVETAIVLHMDPLNSRLAKAAAASFKNVDFPLDQVINPVPDDISELTDTNEKKSEE